MQMDLKKYTDTVKGPVDSMLVKVKAFSTKASLVVWLTSLLVLPELYVPDSAGNCVHAHTSCDPPRP